MVPRIRPFSIPTEGASNKECNKLMWFHKTRGSPVVFMSHLLPPCVEGPRAACFASINSGATHVSVEMAYDELCPPQAPVPQRLSFLPPTLGCLLLRRTRSILPQAPGVQYHFFSAFRLQLVGYVPGAQSKAQWKTWIWSVLKNVLCYLGLYFV